MRITSFKQFLHESVHQDANTISFNFMDKDIPLPDGTTYSYEEWLALDHPDHVRVIYTGFGPTVIFDAPEIEETRAYGVENTQLFFDESEIFELYQQCYNGNFDDLNYDATGDEVKAVESHYSK